MTKLKFKNISKNIAFYIIPIIVLIFNILIILVPNLVINSARNGLLLWVNNILPALLPFIIGTNLLIKLGFIDFLGSILENLMQKVFHVSGLGAFPLVLGMFSGYPVGAKIVCDLRLNKKISKSEGERLLTFTNNSGPLFILGTVGIGMFGSAKLGYLMLLIHYLSALSTGFIFRNYKYEKNMYKTSNKISLKKAFANLKASRLKENKSFGEILGDSVNNALEITVTIGGFIVFFSVISALFLESNIFTYLGDILLPDKLRNLSNGIFMGIIEITNGCSILSLDRNNTSVITAVALISWSGFSILAQTFSLLSKTDLNLKIYLISKIIHSSFAILYGFISLPLINRFLNNSVASAFNLNVLKLQNIGLLVFSIKSILFILLSLILIGFIVILLNKLLFRKTF